MSKVICIAGLERGDFAYYLAVLLSKLGPTMLIDNSLSNDLYGAVCDYTYDKPYIVKQNITYMANKDYSNREDSFFDYVVLWQGMHINMKHMSEADLTYVLPDYTPNCISKLSEEITVKELITKIYMREATEYNKISEKTVAENLGVEAERIAGQFAYDNKDYENYIALLYNGRQTFSKLTPSFNDCLILSLMDAAGMEKKDAARHLSKYKGKA